MTRLAARLEKWRGGCQLQGWSSQGPGPRCDREPRRHDFEYRESRGGRRSGVGDTSRDDAFDDASKDDEKSGGDRGRDHLKGEADAEDRLGDHLQRRPVHEAALGDLQAGEPDDLKKAETEPATEQTRRRRRIAARDP